MFERIDLAFEPGLFANRSRKASKQRFVDGDGVRFDDMLPKQIGGFLAKTLTGSALSGKARSMIGWRPLSQAARYAAIGTHTKLFLLNATRLDDITPTGLVAGAQDTAAATGYGTGAYGMGPYGGPSTGSAIMRDGATWTCDMFGQVLIAHYREGGSIYSFDPETDIRAELIEDAPTAQAVAVSEERHVFAFGCDGDPSLVQWCNRENFQDWDYDPETNPGTRAGAFNMNNSSAWQCGRSCRGLMMGWTLSEVFAFAPLGNALVYSRERLATDCGAAGPQAVAVVTSQDSEMAFWMGESAFFIFDGLVRELPCELKDYVFGSINLTQRVKFHARPNAAFGEIWFSYCSSAATECDRIVIYNYRNNTWSKWTIARLAGIDKGVFDYPMMIDGSGTVFDHERGTTANGSAIAGYVTSHPLMLGTGTGHMEVATFWPDLQEDSGTCQLILFCSDFPGDPNMVTVNAGNFTTTTEKIDLAIDARLIQLKIAGVTGPWEIGLPSASVQAGGER